jgi:hypothetical protein
MNEVIAVFSHSELIRLKLAVMDRRDKLRGCADPRSSDMEELEEKLNQIETRNDMRNWVDQQDLLEAVEKSDSLAIEAWSASATQGVHIPTNTRSQ